MRLLLAAAVLAATLSTAAAELLAPSRMDRLFALPATIEASDDGARLVVDYQEMRDINGRDEIPERRAHATYVDLSVRRAQRDVTVQTPAGNIPHVAVGKAQGASFIVAYLHGQGGSRRQGADDFTFGGNFNRIKNLAAQNGGLYLSPDFADFGATGAGQVAALLKTYANASPQAPIFVACGSAGGAICWQLAQEGDLATRLGGLLLLGSHWDENFLKSPAFRARVPVYLGHGSRDRVFPVERQEAFFRSIRAASPGYPARFVRFETGSHGTPIRMTDWCDVINWMSDHR
ncbi:alpha/beta hydrolase [Aliihoeflea sp. 40Bstr573]|uniref:alpha/beta hydrolase family protein n=1 Tax=Aliihoeflea sp. 40Bstr573 TaxID=2696467 RepID=UPI0020961814|nr:alpha/beta hydrolase [Aliihoeflea sp. 40Bstr573]MCO6385466.1 alpha/beta hydrolase [Aliihoeflea sp. 40Bstr573]